MTLRGLVLGNSHLAAVRLAYSHAENRAAGLELDFVASGQAGLADLALQDGHLIATTPALQADLDRFSGVARVDLARYDLFVLVGLGFNIFAMEPLYREFRCIGLKKWRRHDVNRRLVSASVMRQMAANALEGCLSNRVARLIAGASSRPIYQHIQPRPAEVLLTLEKYPALRRAARRDDGAALGALFDQGAAQAGVGHVLLQPAETIAMGVLTGEAYAAGSTRLTADPAQNLRHPADDFLHANAAYGALVLHQLAQRLQADGLLAT